MSMSIVIEKQVLIVKYEQPQITIISIVWKYEKKIEINLINYLLTSKLFSVT